ncbi:Reverse transcriptase (RNA-dependent DNA polymerase) [Novipirellula galeiformis]|uniref:RNA-directed DNA polymerase n=1 Tax=Novipirellula galeiformis TaxID=2528004 RepID=A0A5C6CKF2_9BACT|nr:reverse transcriptase family protein [Novipirellula galeiformis]TWU24892.1 Reverse transcriptase (RNA-dependent DNA polymerase) [Novipirellula galeiformis]
METWSAHQLYTEAESSLGEAAARNLQAYSEQLRAKGLPVIFSLRHLAELSGVRYWFLHETVNRMREVANYRMFAIKKRSGGRRHIHSVSNELGRVQQWINQHLLQNCKPHAASFAFHKEGGIRQCAERHCGARWLFQFDLVDFFYDVSERDCFNVFKGLGYRPLLAFELARICTTTRLPAWCPRAEFHGEQLRWENIWCEDDLNPVNPNTSRNFPYYERFGRLGALPQGAPTSPMLSNLAAKYLDESLQHFANKNGLIYTRYADDITFSACRLGVARGRVLWQVKDLIKRAHFAVNPKKTRIAGPGSKKLVLGLLVDGSTPRISRETYKRIERLLYGAKQFGFEAAASHFKFDSAYGFHNHLSGLVAFVKDVDRKRWQEFNAVLLNAKSSWGNDV